MSIILSKKYRIYDLEYAEKIDPGQFDGIVIMRIQEGTVAADGGREIVECFGEPRLYSSNVRIYIADEKYSRSPSAIKAPVTSAANLAKTKNEPPRLGKTAHKSPW